MSARRSTEAIYRPLNVRDALSYLDQVKVRILGDLIAGGRLSFTSSRLSLQIQHHPRMALCSPTCHPVGLLRGTTEAVSGLVTPPSVPFGISRVADNLQVQFADQPEVYNRFLDVMKEFKGQM